MEQRENSWWDFHSDQPYQLDPDSRPRLGFSGGREYLTIAASAAFAAPAVLWKYFRLRPQMPLPDAKSFIGLSVSPDPVNGSSIIDMLDELGVKQLLVRIPVWEISRLDHYVRFIEELGSRHVLVNILQDRESVAKPAQWFSCLRDIFAALSPVTTYFQIGNAVNRQKWGCAHSGEYLDLLEIANNLRNEFPHLKLVGSSVIDFEPLVTFRTVWNRRPYTLDVVSALLYVNRRGSPLSRQYGLFDLYNKLRMLYAIVCFGNRNRRRLWITEFNWPLLDTKPYTPNSGHPARTVDEKTQAQYLQQYYRIAFNTGWVERVYWWQLINPGYGLVDCRKGRLRKHPSFFALKELVAGGLTKAERQA